MKRNFMRMNVCLAICASALIGGAFAEEDNALTFNVPEGEVQTYTTQLVANSPNIVKLGAGTLVVSNDNNSAYNGSIEIREGVLEAQSAVIPDGTARIPVFGTANKNRITVFKGAQLRVRAPGPTAQDRQYFSHTLVLAGDGPDGTGAFYYVKAAGGATGNVDNLFSSVILTDDASFGSSTRAGFAGGTMDLGGHTFKHRLLSTHNTQFMNTSTTVKNGHLCLTNSSNYILQGSPKLNADASITMHTGTRLDTWGSAPTFVGPITVAGKSVFRVGAGTESSKNALASPIRLNADLDFTTYSGTANMRATLSGVISGPGKLSSVSGASYSSGYATTQHLYLTCPTNNWTGGIAANYGDIWAEVAGSVPHGPITSTDGRLNFMMGGTKGWDFAAVHNILTNWNGSGAVNIYTSKDQSLTDDAALTQPITYRHGGPGTLTFPLAVTPEGKTRLQNGEGTLVVTSCDEPRYLSELKVAGGTMILDDAGLVYAGERDGNGRLTVTNKTFTVGGANSVTNARLIVRGTSVMGAYVAPGQSKGGFLRVGDTGTKGAILELHAPAIITNTLLMGESCMGAVHQYGGTFYDAATAGNDGSIGSGSGYGYFGLFGGNYSIRSWQALGRNKSAEGVFDHRGGTFTLLGAPFCISRGGSAEYYMTGGTFSQTSSDDYAIYLGNISWADKSAGPMEAVLTLAGADAFMNLRGCVCLSERTNTAVSVVNLNAGVLKATRFVKRNSFADTSIKPSGWKDVFGYVNFNGGTFRAGAANANVFGAGENVKADAVTVFAGGATVDVNGFAVSNGEVPFSGPAGKGVAAIEIPSGTKLDGYIGAPKVSITGGDGHGATAHCAFDPATGRIGPITVVSPGWGFTSAPTVTIKSGDRKSTVSCTATLTEGDVQAAGGLTITNSSATAGTFTLAGANTYRGATVVAGGTLKLAAAESVPAASEVRCAGGTLDLNNLDGLTFATIGGFGSVINGNVAANGIALTADEAKSGKLHISGSLTLPAAAPVRVDGVTASLEAKKYVLITADGGITGGIGEVTGFESLEFPQLWRVTKSGNSILLTYSVGTALILR